MFFYSFFLFLPLTVNPDLALFRTQLLNPIVVLGPLDKEYTANRKIFVPKLDGPSSKVGGTKIDESIGIPKSWK